MHTVTLRRANGRSEVISGRSRATTATEAIARVAARTIGYRHIGTVEHHAGGDTYHIQFVTGRPPRGDGANSLSSLYVATVRKD